MSERSTELEILPTKNGSKSSMAAPYSKGLALKSSRGRESVIQEAQVGLASLSLTLTSELV